MDATNNNQSLTDLLDRIKNSAHAEKRKGQFFENLILSYFQNEPYYQQAYSQIWPFGQWAQTRGLPIQDQGVDLVAQIRDSAGQKGDFCAIQCIFRGDERPIRREEIDSFLVESSQTWFSHRYLVIANSLEPNASAFLESQTSACVVLDRVALGNSQIDWSRYNLETGTCALRPKKELRPHQIEALDQVLQGFQRQDRGILAMACGTGKTLCSLRIAEKLVGSSGFILFLVPSLALLSQVLTEWTREANTALHSFAVCSDAYVGRLNQTSSDNLSIRLHELQFPATTNAVALKNAISRKRDGRCLTVIFSTYQSIDVLSQSQKLGLPAFDLVLCDEAHRTTGSTEEGDEESAFVKIHDNQAIQAKKRLYMTATPKIFAVNNHGKRSDSETVILYSMDNVAYFGPVFHSLPFSKAVREGLLVDYKVIILSMEEKLINRRVKLLKNEDNSLVVSDAAKIVGCFKALAKRGLKEDLVGASAWPMKRAVAFCQIIDAERGRSARGRATHKVSSAQIAKMFAQVVEDYLSNSDEEPWLKELKCEALHVDGSMNVTEKNQKLNWLREDFPDHTCRILSNVRCLSEGVDLPALDAVLFLAPRNSMVEVVQSVGRVMRRAPGKDYGYVVLPVVIPTGLEPLKALDDNKTYKVVWDVLQALRSHDNRFDAWINKLTLQNASDGKIDFISILDWPRKSLSGPTAFSPQVSPHLGVGEPQWEQGTIDFDPYNEFNKAIIAKLVKKVGNPDYLGEWADDVTRIANTYIDRIKAILDDPQNQREIQVFNHFVEELKDDLNDSLSDDEVVEMLAQHMITGPAFEAIFENNSFVKQNPVSVSINKVLDSFSSHHLEKEAVGLSGFYESVKKEVDLMRDKVSGVDNIVGKQKIIVELYDKFFRRAFPKMTQRLGIVYTPVEVVDFIIHSVDELLRREFGKNLGSQGVHIIDPFTGTGTFITRLIQSGLIDKNDLPYKYRNEIHANEIVLLAYYIASINIGLVYHDIIGGDYESFTGIRLTDTFQLYEKDDLILNYHEGDSTKRNIPKNQHLKVIFGNPPYSIGQKSQNDSNKNIAYPQLDEKIKKTYVLNSTAVLSRGMYDNYVRAFRWASDRLKGETDGVVAFVTNSGFVDKVAMNGIRKCLAKDFQSIHVINLRGDIRKTIRDSQMAKEGDNIFGYASMTGIAITFLVKNSQGAQESQIFYHDIGDHLKREEKLARLNSLKSISGVNLADGWRPVTPDANGDWLGQRDESFASHALLGSKKDIRSLRVFQNYSLGVATSRDPWCYNFSYDQVFNHMKNTIKFYNLERKRFHDAFPGLTKKVALQKIEKFIDTDPTKISWSRIIKNDLISNKIIKFDKNSIVISSYRPFTKSWIYFNRDFNEIVSQIPNIFPSNENENMAICVTGVGAMSSFSTLITNNIPNLHYLDTGQCFPYYLYEPISQDDRSLFDNNDSSQSFKRYFAITKESLKQFQDNYPKLSFDRRDFYHYIYGILHSPEYRDRFADNLAKELPRIPMVKKNSDFQAFVEAGQALAKLHLNYETVKKYPLEIIAPAKLSDEDYYVTQMKFGKTGSDNDLTTIIYNHQITLKGIPHEAYDYIVSGKSGVAWLMRYQAARTDKASGIVNDANLWAIETMKNPKYPLELLQRVITVSLETLSIARGLPKLRI